MRQIIKDASLFLGLVVLIAGGAITFNATTATLTGIRDNVEEMKIADISSRLESIEATLSNRSMDQRCVEISEQIENSITKLAEIRARNTPDVDKGLYVAEGQKKLDLQALFGATNCRVIRTNETSDTSRALPN